MEIREALRIASQHAGWSPTKLAAECDVTENTAKRWLSGERLPKAAHFYRLRRLLPQFAELVDQAAA